MVRDGLQAEGEEQGASQDQHGKDFSVNCLKTSQKMSNYQGLFVGSTYMQIKVDSIPSAVLSH